MGHVLEARDEQPAAEVDGLGTGAEQLSHLITAGGGDEVPGGSEAADPGAGGASGVDGAVGEDRAVLAHGEALQWIGRPEAADGA
ncbi:hypothetical protein ACFTWS_07530 [Streptomyces sp. NPDC057027]|uniref:hypothetical protein n=1 Tax=Streptomyces sp. NPDC057027 TaxID=3346004 RepID=UPI0036425326